MGMTKPPASISPHLPADQSMHSINTSIAACHSGKSDSFFGSFVMKSAASFSVSSFRPSGKTIGSSNGVDQGTGISIS
jgi:hypothetical protein